MGGGIYSCDTRSIRADILGYSTKSASAIFTQRSINNAMDPYGLTVRESRDSEEHPKSVAVIIGLDETGSMGSIPHYLVKTGLPTMMDDIIQKGGVQHPQVLFLGLGDHECDQAPLQVGQFESSDELLDKWLTDVYLEGRGGGNDGESYLLAWYLAAKHTSIDCFEKRSQKGVLFTIGDEPTLQRIPRQKLKSLFGDGQYSDVTAAELIEEASKTWYVFHIHVRETRSGSRQSVLDGWKQLLQENVLVAERKEDIPGIIAETVTRMVHAGVQKPVMTESKVPTAAQPEEEILL